MTKHAPRVERLAVRAYDIATDAHESDGTFEWDSTAAVVVSAHSEGETGVGYTYCDAAAALLIDRMLRPLAEGRDALAVRALWDEMQIAVRNVGRTGISAMAISAMDIALWDLSARLNDLPLVSLLGCRRSAVPIYGSGGFTSYGEDRLAGQLAGWIEQGIPRVKMKVGRDPSADPDRVALARKAIGDSAELFVDANGAYGVKQAVAMSRLFAESGVTWFEEPVSSDDRNGLATVKADAPPGMEVAAGEYGFDLDYFESLLNDGCVDVLQADVTRCGGITGCLDVDALCRAHHVPLSLHTAPQIDAHVGLALGELRHAEYFHDHVRVESLLFDGVLEPQNGVLQPDASVSGTGLVLKERDVEPYLCYESA